MKRTQVLLDNESIGIIDFFIDLNYTKRQRIFNHSQAIRELIKKGYEKFKEENK